jgi:phosphoenolpyruvate carboxykinase (ATP)
MSGGNDMGKVLYEPEQFARFYKRFKQLLNGSNIRTVGLKDLREPAIQTAQQTRFGSFGWRSSVSSRIAPRTVYLGSESVRIQNPSDLQKDLIKNAPEELEKVLHLMKTLPIVHLRRQMGHNDEFNPVCNLYTSILDTKNHRIPYMWGHTMFDVSKKMPGPELIMVHIPEEHALRQQVLVLPEYNLNIALGTDYMGEDKKGFLRQAMWCADREGFLGLHAGTKIVRVRDSRDDKLRTYGVYLFGLSATGKSTWSCHQLGLDVKGEGTWVTQDDIVFMREDGSAIGSEDNYFVKTDVTEKYQEAMYNSLIHKSALMENVMIDSRGNPDFLDESLCANGRAVIARRQLKVRTGRRRKSGIFSRSVDLPSVEELDGIIFAFITRRNTIMPFAQQLTPEQAVLAYLWGESSHSFASQPAKAGESVRIVGTDPFIVGSRAWKVNRFYEIIMNLVDNHPGKVRFFQYNTGGIGEIIESYTEHSIRKKRVIRKVNRVPISVMAAIQRGDLRGTNRYETGPLGRLALVECEGKRLDEYNPANYYSQDQINDYIRELVEGRKEFTDEISREGLISEVLNDAEKSFSILPKSRHTVPVQKKYDTLKKKEEISATAPSKADSTKASPEDVSEAREVPEEERAKVNLSTVNKKARLSRPRGWRYG